MLYKIVATLAVTLATMKANQATSDVDHSDEKYSTDYFEGDIILPLDQKRIMASRIRLWPKHTVFIYMDPKNPHFDDEHRNFILKAIYRLAEVSCLKFKMANPLQHGRFINITTHEPGCRSHVGYQNKIQILNLEYSTVGKKCFRLETILHEILHAIGFQHQQSAYERDDYVEILWDNIGKNYHKNFLKQTERNNYGLRHDYLSIMHYHQYDFAINKEIAIRTIDTKYQDIIDSSKDLSDLDIKKLNRMYNCRRNV